MLAVTQTLCVCSVHAFLLRFLSHYTIKPNRAVPGIARYSSQGQCECKRTAPEPCRTEPCCAIEAHLAMHFQFGILMHPRRYTKQSDNGVLLVYLQVD